MIFGKDRHLRQILRAYARYYNNIRTHRSLDKDAPAFRSVQRVGTITSYAILGGLHHRYVRISFRYTQDKVFGTHRADLSMYSQAQLNKVARQLNERPRATLGFETPAQRFNACVASIA
jgi:hypothetical protein